MQEESGASQPWLGKWGQQARASVGNSIQDGDQVASPLPTHSPQLDGHLAINGCLCLFVFHLKYVDMGLVERYKETIISGLQLAYTVIFGSYASFLFVRCLSRNKVCNNEQASVKLNRGSYFVEDLTVQQSLRCNILGFTYFAL
ncbi:hypothetical protein RHMOL_Rhmol05G0157800 [Rhododendron molle]|uniref:Uncharacterized protein n=1 Tax=Rhododendron molle TaxID=49168 RepID=A0ACC0NRV2_RHOML|nr:hypothetical protein RHMOL_Rhmol05G0157800 [Rhododendron molle]